MAAERFRNGTGVLPAHSTARDLIDHMALNDPSCLRRAVSATATIAAGLAGAIVVAGCGAQLPGGIATGTLELPKIALAIPEGSPQPKGTPLEIYTRVARGVLTCWLGAHGPLKETHIFDAESEPERMGGVSRISVHEQNRQRENGLGQRAVLVTISPLMGSANVEIQNFRLPKPQEEEFHVDVRRWAAGDEGCLAGGVQEGWAAQSASVVQTGNKKAARDKKGR